MKNGTLEERGRDLARRLKRATNQDLVNELVDEVEKLKTPHYRALTNFRPERRSDRQRRQGRMNERRAEAPFGGGRRVLNGRRIGNERRDGYTILTDAIIREASRSSFDKPVEFTPYRQFSGRVWRPVSALRRFGASDRRDPDLFPTLGRRVFTRRRWVEAFGGRRRGGERRTSFPTARVRRKGAADRRQG